MLELLEQLFRQVRAYMQSERFNHDQVYSQSPEHTTMQFDREAEDIIISGLIESGHGFAIKPLMIISSASRSNCIVVCSGD